MIVFEFWYFFHIDIIEDGCVCDGTEYTQEDGLIIGECKYADSNGHFCYVNKKRCAAPGNLGETSRYTNKWISYGLCNCRENADCNLFVVKSPQAFGK